MNLNVYDRDLPRKLAGLPFYAHPQQSTKRYANDSATEGESEKEQNQNETRIKFNFMNPTWNDSTNFQCF